jgi:hypothetical protein
MTKETVTISVYTYNLLRDFKTNLKNNLTSRYDSYQGRYTWYTTDEASIELLDKIKRRDLEINKLKTEAKTVDELVDKQLNHMIDWSIWEFISWRINKKDDY